jgi:hypothetical protein
MPAPPARAPAATAPAPAAAAAPASAAAAPAADAAAPPPHLLQTIADFLQQLTAQGAGGSGGARAAVAGDGSNVRPMPVTSLAPAGGAGGCAGVRTPGMRCASRARSCMQAVLAPHERPPARMHAGPHPAHLSPWCGRRRPAAAAGADVSTAAHPAGPGAGPRPAGAPGGGRLGGRSGGDNSWRSSGGGRPGRPRWRWPRRRRGCGCGCGRWRWPVPAHAAGAGRARPAADPHPGLPVWQPVCRAGGRGGATDGGGAGAGHRHRHGECLQVPGGMAGAPPGLAVWCGARATAAAAPARRTRDSRARHAAARRRSPACSRA